MVFVTLGGVRHDLTGKPVHTVSDQAVHPAFLGAAAHQHGRKRASVFCACAQTRKGVHSLSGCAITSSRRKTKSEETPCSSRRARETPAESRQLRMVFCNASRAGALLGGRANCSAKSTRSKKGDSGSHRCGCTMRSVRRSRASHIYAEFREIGTERDGRRS